MSAVARIVTTCQNGRGHPTMAGNREYMLALFDRALAQRPDLVCFPETFTSLRAEDVVAEPVPGPTTDAFAAKARAHGCYAICPIRTERDGEEWNSAVVIGRNGAIEGVYDKAQPVTTSNYYTTVERGAMPGGDPPVFDLDFGRIGIQICFDAGFPETWEALARAGAKAVFWPSAYDGGFSLEAYAYLHHYYIITSVQTERSRFIDPCGRIVAHTDRRMDLVRYDLNLDFVVCHYDFNQAIPDRITDAYPDRVKVTSYQEDAHFLIEPTDPNMTSEQLRGEFGFESSAEYHDRHRKAYASLRKGDPAIPQMAAHRDRSMYTK